MKSKMATTVALCVFFSIFALAGSIDAKSGNSASKTRFEADLDPCCANVEPEAKGDAEFRLKTQKGAIKEKRFRAKIEIPIPNTLNIDESNAASADIRLILTRAGVDYAECSFVFTEIEQEFEDGVLENVAEYKIDIRQKKNGSVRSQKGTCNPELPDVLEDDIATVMLVVNPADRTQDIDLLQGTFDPH
jgi:hypothetical protein